MLKPEMLKKNDKIAIVSLSSGMLGEKEFIHKYYIAKERLEHDFGLEVVTMPNALKGIDYVYNHPEARAKDLMDAFKDPTIKAIITSIGGDDTIRLLPYIDFDIIKNNPKIFMGFSDTTVNHFMMNKAGLVSYYGPTIMCDFGEYVKMFDYTKEAVENILFKDSKDFEIKHSQYVANSFVPWSEDNINVPKELKEDEHGYEVIQGSGIVTGKVLGGCIEVFPMMVGTSIWPSLAEWKDKIILLETSEDKPAPEIITYYLRNLGAQGIFDVIKGIMVGKPQGEKYYEEYKEVYKKVLKEYHHEELPIIYNVNIGHASPIGIIPLGIDMKIDFDNKKIYLAESACLSNKYEMKLANDPFEHIKKGTKTIELRLNDEKRKLLKIKDLIEFTNRDTNEKIMTEVEDLYQYPSFAELYKHFDKISLGYNEDEIANPEDMEKYYSKEEQEQYGVLGIKIKKL